MKINRIRLLFAVCYHCYKLRLFFSVSISHFIVWFGVCAIFFFFFSSFFFVFFLFFLMYSILNVYYSRRFVSIFGFYFLCNDFFSLLDCLFFFFQFFFRLFLRTPIVFRFSIALISFVSVINQYVPLYLAHKNRACSLLAINLARSDRVKERLNDDRINDANMNQTPKS